MQRETKDVEGTKKFPFSLYIVGHMQIEDLQEIISKGIQEVGFTDIYLIDVKIKDNKIEIFLDSDEGITFLKCQKLSRWLEGIFDEKGSFGQNYILDVSSAGVGSPLKLKKQYFKNIGRFIEIKYMPQEKARGLLAEVNDNFVVVTFDEKIKEGKKNKTVSQRVEIPFEKILEAKIKLSL
ncbi:MAG: ribosome maturation factor [Saprospiraceae bacterium]|nr:ribosome maturation factor [Saprospiraceae bacterium]MBK6564615.1 ribosome maturation factor [Saprospiraceae bacterium]MBK6782800.1 ribosome maturation factor [Saprospiraceae bacterium]MBK7523256.1 ribosome maturation factor [Saprospiraceae bacterium]MBK8079348.1 ribosome maturation factor [Saprospiraceae bacterium]